MYKLTARMLQNLNKGLTRFHELFDGGRCDGWGLEELIVKAIKSDTSAHHHVFWKEAGHDDKTDIIVRINGGEFPIQIKSGKIYSNGRLVLSGYRLGRFKGDFEKITDYLKGNHLL